MANSLEPLENLLDSAKPNNGFRFPELMALLAELADSSEPLDAAAARRVSELLTNFLPRIFTPEVPITPESSPPGNSTFAGTASAVAVPIVPLAGVRGATMNVPVMTVPAMNVPAMTAPAMTVVPVASGGLTIPLNPPLGGGALELERWLAELARRLRALGRTAAEIARIISRLRALAPALAAAGPYGAGAIIMLIGWAVFFSLLAANRAPLVDLNRAEANVQSFAEAAAGLLSVDGLFNDCARRCLEQFLAEARRMIREVRTGGDLSDAALSQLEKALVSGPFTALINCLARCGVPKVIIDRLIAVFFNFRKSMRLALGLPLLGLLDGLRALLDRNAQRENAHNGEGSGWHRKCGFAYEELPDDREENPDISEEDPNEEVDIADVQVDPAVDGSRFTDEQLETRKGKLRQWSRDLMANISDLEEAMAELREDVAAEADAINRLAAARRVAIKDLRKLKAALRNALLECIRRANARGETNLAERLLREAESIDIHNP